ncbi:protein arginine N-methyltransferase 7 [Physcomitrium patens]|uniref:Protein arginine N-methyltransferase domain-containing protein n=1 Tax=Physcomitrium patens TaxID=3218 RepID=A0A2K1KGN7_PHYPA|nr:protein arginine N-methyltransferase 7-like [Physcomitrium patens]PNR52944.1 hypothetical protein PHYPA_009319 [Physcomitrium patens]|eukprot:XP_024378297.1 protein arginine N-methyltransferase 7-like [Physcomitrella patens]
MVTLHTVSALHSNVLEWSGYLSEELWNIVIAMEQLKNVGTSQSQAPSSAVLMQQSLNKLTGQVEWIVVRQDDPEDGEGQNHLFGSSAEEVSEALTMTTFLDMLNDAPRNRAYRLAIQKAVKGAHHVLDIGAGTGLLSMMAWRSMCEEGRISEEMGSITACESFLPMFKLARKVLRANKVGAGVRLIHKRSDEMEVGIDMHCRADVLISEILDSELLGEGLIPSLRHAHQNLLTKNARCVPHTATVYAQLVECEHLWKCHDLPGVESQLVDGVVLASRDYNQFRGRAAAMHVDPLASEMQLLSEPFEVFTFELSKAPDESGQRQHSVLITNSGRAHALVSWWVLQLDIEGEIFYSTAPNWIKNPSANVKAETIPQTEWCEHWKQMVWILPGKGLMLYSGNEVVVTASHDAVSVSYNVTDPVGSYMHKDVVPKDNVDCPVLFEASMSPDRIGILGHEPWRRSVKSAVEIALRCLKTSLCVVVDDSLLVTMMAASVRANVQVVAMFPGSAVGQEYVDDISRTLGQNVANIKVMNKIATPLSLEVLGVRKIDLLMAEPYYTSCSRMLPWRLLRFWYERTQLSPLLSDNVKLVPCRASLRGVAVHMPDLWKSRRFIKDVEGFDHRLVNSVFGACGELPSLHEVPILPFAVWQCGRYEELTDVFTVIEFDFSYPLRTMEGVIEAAVQRAGQCHGIVLWMDWSLDPEGSYVLSTGPAGGRPTYWKQGVKLLRSPVEVGVKGLQLQSTLSPSDSSNELPVNSVVEVTGHFDSRTGDLKVTTFFA